MAGKSVSPPSFLVLTGNTTTIQHVEFILEQFFNYHIAYQWDKAREYIEHERDQFRHAKHSILSSMLHCLAQVVMADRNYLMLQFFSSKVFQRKDSLKTAYEHLRTEFQRLEERSNQIFLRQNFHLLPFQSSPVHVREFSSSSVSSEPSRFGVGGGQESDDVEMELAKDALQMDLVIDEPQSSPPEVGGFQHHHHQHPGYMRALSSSSFESKDAPNTGPGDTGTKSGSFFSKFLRRFSSNPVPASRAPPPPASHGDAACSSPLVPADSYGPEDMIAMPDSHSFTNLDSLDQYAGHICGQLVNYCRVRIEMIDFYERLTMAGSSPTAKFIQMDDLVATLAAIHNRGDDGFHHPVLTRLKIMFMFECDILLALLHAHQHIKRWRYLETLFSLQDAHNKIARLANPREFFFGHPGSGGGANVVAAAITPTSTNAKPSPTSPGGQNRRAIPVAVANNSLSSSGSSSLSLPTIKDTGNYSPMSPSNLNFIYPSSSVKEGNGDKQPEKSAAKNLFQRARDSTRSGNESSIPLLIQWFNRYKLFLLSKYSFYFHTQLIIHLTPVTISSSTSSISGANTSAVAEAGGTSGSNTTSAALHSSNSFGSLLNNSQLQTASPTVQTEIFMRNLCSKHSLFDFHTRIVQFVKRMPDPCTVMMVLNLTGKENDISLIGYRSPFRHQKTPQGLDSMPIIYSYPSDLLLLQQKHPALVMIMENRKRELNGSDAVVVEHDHHRSNSSSGPSTPSASSATYYLVRPDPDITIALVCDSPKHQLQYQQQPVPGQNQQPTRTERDAHHIGMFMAEMCAALKDGKILASLRTGSFK